jgi:hypothetical protein
MKWTRDGKGWRSGDYQVTTRPGVGFMSGTTRYVALWCDNYFGSAGDARGAKSLCEVHAAARSRQARASKS